MESTPRNSGDRILEGVRAVQGDHGDRNGFINESNRKATGNKPKSGGTFNSRLIVQEVNQRREMKKHGSYGVISMISNRDATSQQGRDQSTDSSFRSEAGDQLRKHAQRSYPHREQTGGGRGYIRARVPHFSNGY